MQFDQAVLSFIINDSLLLSYLRKNLNLTTDEDTENIEMYKRAEVTCISGSIPFPKMAAIMEIEVKALKTLADFEDSKE